MGGVEDDAGDADEAGVVELSACFSTRHVEGVAGGGREVEKLTDGDAAHEWVPGGLREQCGLLEVVPVMLVNRALAMSACTSTIPSC
ncbi:hypothetical protein BFF78_01150 [Streptomyces fodineus]|uniref:Uncharacterized protein n=1 Tax=Streptomyces fodineus TaxID=1904616 RepID=A0A1D7Y2S2_9ACTN|nr:hypothetical protein [Streptomyces fodineus]AOR29873.1 hypothetical protein BFF78_01150 [Streptomyces fodineus]